MSKKKKQIELPLSDFVENFFYLKGQPFSLKDYPHMRTIYNIDADKLVLKFSRQTAKSTTLSNMLLSTAYMSPQIRQLYVSPAVAQTQEFARDKLEPLITQSPISKNFVDSNQVQNVFKKEFKNGSVINLRYALLNADRIRGISADINMFDECFTPDMEALTKEGWKNIKDLSLTDELATVNSKHELEYQLPSRVIEKDYEGEIHVYKHQSSLLKVTPGHNLLISQNLNTGYYKNPKVSGWNLVTSEEALDKNFKMSAAPTVTIKEYTGPDTITVPGGDYDFSLASRRKRVDGKILKYDPESFPIKPFYKFMGWFLSEGSIGTNSHNIFLTQKEGKDANIIRQDLKSLNVSWEEVKDEATEIIQFRIYSKALWHYLLPLGKSHEKYIPEELLKDDRTALLPHLLDRLYKGDAIKRPGTSNPQGELKTSSKQLADSVQRAWLLLGHRSSIRQSDDGIKRGHKHLHYLVRKLQRSYQVFWKTNKRVNKENYKGKVYCATVPNSTLIVRHQDEKGVFITGNCQDLRKDVIGVIEETMSRSEVKKSIYVGTPKRSKGTLADFWFNSTQNEYAVKSSASGHWNILGPDNIGLNGLIDSKSGHPLDLRVDKGEWVSTYSNNKERPDMEGFRVCLLHFANSPWVRWEKDVIYKMENQSTGLFYNETLGLEYDSGAIPITKDQIMQACNEGYTMTGEPSDMSRGKPSIMGIDYGPVNSENSYTVISIVQEWDGKFQVVYTKKFIGKEADYAHIHEEIPKLFNKWNCILLASDYGMGEAPNSEFRARLGLEKVMPFQHLPTQKEPMRYNPKMAAYTLNKTNVMNMFFNMLKKGKLRLPKWSDIETTAATDIQNIIIEYDEEKNTQRFTNIGPDDFVHATLFACMAGMFILEDERLRENLS